MASYVNKPALPTLNSGDPGNAPPWMRSTPSAIPGGPGMQPRSGGGGLPTFNGVGTAPSWPRNGRMTGVKPGTGGELSWDFTPPNPTLPQTGGVNTVQSPMTGGVNTVSSPKPLPQGIPSHYKQVGTTPDGQALYGVRDDRGARLGYQGTGGNFSADPRDGEDMYIDANGVPRFHRTANAYGTSYGEWEVPRGDGFTGMRDGKAFVRGHMANSYQGDNAQVDLDMLLRTSGDWLTNNPDDPYRHLLGDSVLPDQIHQYIKGNSTGTGPRGWENAPLIAGGLRKGGGAAGDGSFTQTKPITGMPDGSKPGGPLTSKPIGPDVKYPADGPGAQDPAGDVPNIFKPSPFTLPNWDDYAGPGGSVTADMTGLPGIDTDFTGAAARGADAAYQGATQFMDQDFEQDRQALEAKLVNQGFSRGTEAFDREMEQLTRGQNAARQSAAFQAQGVGHQQAGDLLLRALQSRGALGGERERAAEREIAQLLARSGQDLSRYGIDVGAILNRRGQDIGVYNTDTSAELARRGLGLSEDNQGFQQLMALIAASRGGVNMPNFGAASPLDVSSAYGIANSNRNGRLAREASDRAGLYGLGAAALGGIDWASLFG